MKPKLTPAEKRAFAIKISNQDLDRRLGSSFCQREDLAALERMQKTQKVLEPPHKRAARLANKSP